MPRFRAKKHTGPLRSCVLVDVESHLGSLHLCQQLLVAGKPIGELAGRRPILQKVSENLCWRLVKELVFALTGRLVERSGNGIRFSVGLDLLGWTPVRATCVQRV